MNANGNPFVMTCICTIEELIICFLSNKQLLIVCFFKIGFLYLSLAVIELTIDQAGLELRDPSVSAFLLGAEIKSMHHHILLLLFFSVQVLCLHAHLCTVRVPEKTRKAVGFPGAGTINSCESPTHKGTQVPGKSHLNQ